MIYLVLAVDPFGIPLSEKGGPPSSDWPVELSEDLRECIMTWNRHFTHLIAANHLYSQETARSLYPELNAEGRKLAERVVREIGGGAKVEFVEERHFDT